MVVTGGQRNDGAMMQDTLKDIYVPRPTGRPRTTPDTVMADRGYTSGVNREYLRDHHVKAVIPQKKDDHGGLPGYGPVLPGSGRLA